MHLDDWDGAVVSPDVDEPPSPAEWHRVDLPGRPARFAGADAVAYRTTLPDPRDGESRAMLTLSGLYGRATAWLDGERLGDHDAYFRPARFAVDPGPESELVVVCRRPDRFGGLYETDEVPDEVAVPGVWWDARVEARPEAFLRDLAVTPRRTDDGWVIDASLTVDAGRAVDDSATLSLRPEGFRGGGTMDRVGVEAAAGEVTTVETTVPVREPRLWRPQGRGNQSRYTVRAKLGDDSLRATTGLRTVERDDDGFLVNGERLRVRGVGLLPGEDLAADVARAVEANANLVRARAHVPPPSVYEACDEAGVLVWQDLPLTGPAAYDPDRAREVAAHLAAAAAGHPSVGCYALHDEPADVTAGLAGARLHRYRLRWRAWRADAVTVDGTVAEPLPDDAAVVPVVGQPGVDPDAASLSPGWSFGTPGDVEWLLDWQPGLADAVGAFGAGSLADAGDDETGPADVAGFDAAAHAVHVADGDVAASQAHQARVLGRVAETLRRRGSGAVVAAALRDADDGAGMGVLARDGTEKAAFEALAASFEPVQAMLDDWPEAGAEVGVVVVNDTPEAVAGTVTWSAGPVDGATEFAVDAFDRQRVGGLEVPDGVERVGLSVDLGERDAENEYRVG